MTKRRSLFIVCMLCMLATLLFLPGAAAYAKAEDGELEEDPPAANAILKSDGNAVPSGFGLEWRYGDDDIISYTFRPQHGDTAYYTVSTEQGQEKAQFAAKYTGDAVAFYEVKNNTIDLTTEFWAQTLNAYFTTLKAGKYSLNVKVPSGSAPATHSHWWEAGGDVTCGVTYAESELDVQLNVNAYEFTESNVGASTSDDSNVTVRYTVPNARVLYTGEANNVPEIELTFATSGGTRTLVEGEDYVLSSDTVEVDNTTDGNNAELTIKGIGGFSGSVTIQNAYKIVQAENSVSDVYVVRWKYGEYDRNVNRFTADVKWGEEDLYFSIATDTSGAPESYVEGLDEIRLTEGMVSEQVEQALNKLDAKKKYYLYATVAGGKNYYLAQAHTQFDVVEVTNTWTTTPSVVSWEWHGFDENINAINAVPAFGDSVKLSIYTKDGDEYNAVKFGGKDSFELDRYEGENKIPDNVVAVLSELDAGMYYLFASVISSTDNYSSINEEFNADALVPFRVTPARNYWTQIPKISNWAYGGYDPKVNIIVAAAAHGSFDIRYRIYKRDGNGVNLLSFSGTSSFSVSANGTLPAAVTEGLKSLGVGKYYLRAEIAGTDNYTGLQETVADFSALPSFEVIKAENYWSTAPAITAWAEGNYSNESNLPVAASHYGVARIVIVDVDDEENVIYDSENGINNLSQAKVGTYLLTATVEGTDDYGALTFDRIFHVFVPETDTVGIPWWLVLIIVVCSLGVLAFIFWLLHEKGVLQMLTSKMIVSMRTKATMDATIAAVRATRASEEAKENARQVEELERRETERTESEQNDSAEDNEAILVESDAQTGIATYVRYQRPFSVKLIQAPDEAKEYYSQLKNELLSYKKVKSKLSKGYDAFNKGRIKLAKLVIRGKTLCLYLPLNPDDYAGTKYKVERSESKKFADVPCLYRIKNARRMAYAMDLIDSLCEKLGLVQGEIKDEDYRPPYESTEQLLEKGLIKKVTYKRKIGGVPNAVQAVSASAGSEGEEPARQDAAPAAPDTETEEQTEPAVATDEAAAATNEPPAAEDDTNAASGN